MSDTSRSRPAASAVPPSPPMPVQPQPPRTPTWRVALGVAVFSTTSAAMFLFSDTLIARIMGLIGVVLFGGFGSYVLYKRREG